MDSPIFCILTKIYFIDKLEFANICYLKFKKAAKGGAEKMKRIISISAKTGHQFLKTLNLVFLSKNMSELFSFIRIGEELHFVDMSGPDLVRSTKYALADAGANVEIFLDLRFIGNSEEVEDIVKKYFVPGMISISSACSVETIIALRRLLPKTKLAMVSLLPDLSPEECNARFGIFPEEKIFEDYNALRNLYQKRISSHDNPEPFDVIMCSPRQLKYLAENILNCLFIVEGEKGTEITGSYQAGSYQMIKLKNFQKACAKESVAS